MPTVYEDMMFAPLNYGMSREEAEKKVDAALERLGLTELKHRHNHRLSGGEKRMAAIATILALKEGIIPPTINHFEDDPQIDPELDFTFNTARKRDIQYAMSNAFGFGGQNSTLLFKKYTL